MHNTQLTTIPGKDLLTRPIAPLQFTISEILPHGLFILAGSPKVGKSWLALDICRAVAEGDTLWNYQAEQGDVLYLALEDNPSRLQERLGKVSPDCDLETPTDIHFATRAQRLDDGLAEQLNAFLDAHPRTKLVVIDTLQYIRSGTSSSGTYAGDYRDMDTLREIINGRNLTLLLITHTRKTGDSDPLNLVSGSTGLSGAADGVFILKKEKRSGADAKLTIINRDTDGHELFLRFDTDNCRWSPVIEVDKSGIQKDDSLCELIGFLVERYPIWSGTATQLCDALSAMDKRFKKTPIALSRALKSRQEFLREQYAIECDFSRSKAARIIVLTHQSCKAETLVDAESAACPLAV